MGSPVRFAVVTAAQAHRWLAGILVAALAMRIAWGLAQPAQPDVRLGDQFEYLTIAKNLLATGELKFYDPRFAQDVHAYRTPGYPLFVRLCHAEIGVVRIMQALIDTATVLAVYLLARRWLERGASVFAAALVAFNPFLVYFTALLLTETLFTAMLAWGMVLLTARAGDGSLDETSARRRVIGSRLAGIAVLALAALVRPSAMGLAILLPMLLGVLAPLWAKEDKKHMVGGAHPTGLWAKKDMVGGAHPTGRTRLVAGLAWGAVGGLAVALVLLPWAMRNAYHPRLRTWIWTTTNAGITSYDGFHDRATGASRQEEFLADLMPRLWHMSEVERDRYLGQEAANWRSVHLGRSVQLAGIKILRTWSPIPLSKEYGSSPLYVAAGLLYGLPLDLLVLIGLVLSRRLGRSAKVFLLLPAIYFTVIHALSVGSLRYRIPAEPPMSIVAACGVSVLARRFFHGPSQRNA